MDTNFNSLKTDWTNVSFWHQERHVITTRLAQVEGKEVYRVVDDHISRNILERFLNWISLGRFGNPAPIKSDVLMVFNKDQFPDVVEKCNEYVKYHFATLNDKQIKLKNYPIKDINSGKITLNSLALTSEDIDLIANHITHLDLSTYDFENWSEEKIHQFISKFSNVRSLVIQDHNLKSLPATLPLLKRLNCANCSSLKSIPYRNLVTLNCDGCSNLQQLPPLTQIERLECNACHSLEEFPPELSQAPLKYLSCSDCTKLVQLPQNPNLRTLICDRCLNLNQQSIEYLESFG